MQTDVGKRPGDLPRTGLRHEHLSVEALREFQEATCLVHGRADDRKVEPPLRSNIAVRDLAEVESDAVVDRLSVSTPPRLVLLLRSMTEFLNGCQGALAGRLAGLPSGDRKHCQHCVSNEL